MPDATQLTDLQIALLRVLWDRREATVAEIAEALRPGQTIRPPGARLGGRGPALDGERAHGPPVRG